MTVLPPVVIILAIVIQLTNGEIVPFFFIICMIELGYAVWSLADFHRVFYGAMEPNQESCIAIRVLRARIVALGVVSNGLANNAIASDEFFRISSKGIEEIAEAEEFLKL